MNKKTVITVVAVLAGVGYAMWKNKKESKGEDSKGYSSACGCGA
jgi:hypothetical protein